MPGELTSLLVMHEDRAVVYPDPFTVATPDAEFDLCRLARARGVFVGLAYEFAIVWVDPRQQRIKTGWEIVSSEPSESRESRTDIVKCAIGPWLQVVECDRQLIDEYLELRLLLTESGFGRFLSGDILDLCQ